MKENDSNGSNGFLRQPDRGNTREQDFYVGCSKMTLTFLVACFLCGHFLVEKKALELILVHDLSRAA